MKVKDAVLGVSLTNLHN